LKLSRIQRDPVYISFISTPTAVHQTTVYQQLDRHAPGNGTFSMPLDTKSERWPTQETKLRMTQPHSPFLSALKKPLSDPLCIWDDDIVPNWSEQLHPLFTRQRPWAKMVSLGSQLINRPVDFTLTTNSLMVDALGNPSLLQALAPSHRVDCLSHLLSHWLQSVDFNFHTSLSSNYDPKQIH
jgi:hypothetical protein